MKSEILIVFLVQNQVQEDAERIIAMTLGALEWLVVPVTHTFRMSYMENR